MNLFARLRRRRADKLQRHPMHRCVVCRSRLVNAIHVQRWDADRSLVVLRCADCRHERTGLFDEAARSLYELQQDVAAYTMRESLKAMQATHAREEMAARVELFVEALHADAIGPEDFAERGAA